MKKAQMPCACTIAGSDSGGGAGISADIKTFSAHGVWGCFAVTSVTAQNPAKVSGVWHSEPEAVSLQIETILEEYRVSAFKTGMLPTKEIIKAVSGSLPEDVPLVIDPVMIATSGRKLVDDEAFFELKKLIQNCTLITPNIPEACRLSELKKISCKDDIINAGKIILDMGAENVLIKGGHMKGQYSEDYLISQNEVIIFSGRRYPFEIHGSGCSLSSAITAGLAKGNSIQESCKNAKKFIESSIKNAYPSINRLYSINPASI